MEGTEQIAFARGIEGIDQQITLWINSFHFDWLQPFWIFMSEKLVWIPLYLAIIAIMIWRFGWKKGLVYVLTILLAFAISERMCNLIKHIFMRPRPCANEIMLAKGIFAQWFDSSPSFPSAHAFNTFTFAASTSYLLGKDNKINWRPLGVVLYAWAFIIALSRVMLAKHFFGDVMTGAILGIVTGLVVSRIGYNFAKLIKGQPGR